MIQHALARPVVSRAARLPRHRSVIECRLTPGGGKIFWRKHAYFDYPLRKFATPKKGRSAVFPYLPLIAARQKSSRDRSGIAILFQSFRSKRMIGSLLFIG
jgi:hypothetical protein